MSKKTDNEESPMGRGAPTDANLGLVFSDPKGRFSQDEGEHFSVNEFSEQLIFSKSELIKAQKQDTDLCSLEKRSLSGREEHRKNLC